jgi:transcriptional antiterminator NusG
MSDTEQAKWYVVHTYSGYETKVKESIENTVKNRHLQEQILEVRVPLQEVTEMKNGTPKASKKKMLPGYVLINMFMNDDTWYVVRNTGGVTGFVGPGSKAVPLTDSEVNGIKQLSSQEETAPDFAVGDVVMVTDGSWANEKGKVLSVNLQRRTAKVLMTMFDRDTPVEFSFSVIKSI